MRTIPQNDIKKILILSLNMHNKIRVDSEKICLRCPGSSADQRGLLNNYPCAMTTLSYFSSFPFPISSVGALKEDFLLRLNQNKNCKSQKQR